MIIERIQTVIGGAVTRSPRVSASTTNEITAVEDYTERRKREQSKKQDKNSHDNAKDSEQASRYLKNQPTFSLSGPNSIEIEADPASSPSIDITV